MYIFSFEQKSFKIPDENVYQNGTQRASRGNTVVLEIHVESTTERKLNIVSAQQDRRAKVIKLHRQINIEMVTNLVNARDSFIQSLAVKREKSKKRCQKSTGKCP